VALFDELVLRVTKVSKDCGESVRSSRRSFRKVELLELMQGVIGSSKKLSKVAMKKALDAVAVRPITW